MRLSGKWRIVEMALWDREAIELLGPAFIELDGEGGQFRFIGDAPMRARAQIVRSGMRVRRAAAGGVIQGERGAASAPMRG